jgi:hypothetical protein
MFVTSVIMQVGNGAHTLFMDKKGLGGADIASIAPEVVAAVPNCTRKTRLVSEALHGTRWIRDITGSLSAVALTQYVHLWDRLHHTHLRSDEEDKFIWQWSPYQQYSAASAYRAFFHGQCGIPAAKELGKTQAAPRCKFFIWLALLGRCWTSVHLQHHNLANDGPCALGPAS